MARRSRVGRPPITTGEAYYPSTRRVPRGVVTAGEDYADLLRLSQLRSPSDTVYPWYQSRVLQRGVTRGFVAHPLRSVLPSVLSFDREPAPRAQRRRAMQLSVDPRIEFCVRRKQRRQVLFAYGKAGFRGSARKRHWNRNENSTWRC